MGMPKTAKRLHKESNQDLIADEVEAIDNYDKAIEGSDNPEAIATYEHIKGEEQEHIDELEGLDKMLAEDITSEQAWQDFKAGYADFEEKHVKSVKKDREGDQASLEEKIDVLSAKLSELNTDMSRLTDSVPQALGTIEEGKTLEEEAEEKQEGDLLDDTTGEDGGLFEGDDGLDEYFADADGADGAPTDAEGEDAQGDADGAEDDTGDADAEVAEEDVQVSDDDVNDTEVSEDMVVGDGAPTDADADENYVSDDDAVDDTGDADADADADEGDEPTEEKTEEEEIIEKMVNVLDRLEKRVSHLERENDGLKKMLSQRNMNVQAEPRNVAKSRPIPNTNLKLVKGSYNRPPVSTQYVANQRDIGIGLKKESAGKTSMFGRGLNEVFEDCERIANQTH